MYIVVIFGGKGHVIQHMRHRSPANQIWNRGRIVADLRPLTKNSRRFYFRFSSVALCAIACCAAGLSRRDMWMSGIKLQNPLTPLQDSLTQRQCLTSVTAVVKNSRNKKGRTIPGAAGKGVKTATGITCMSPVCSLATGLLAHRYFVKRAWLE